MPEKLEPQILLIVEYIRLIDNDRLFTVYLDGNLEIENVESLPSDFNSHFELGDEKVNIREIIIEDVNEGFQSEHLTVFPTESTELFDILDRFSTKLGKGRWRLHVDTI